MACSKFQPASYVEEMLTCSVCLELVTEPQTLTKCLHNYCTKCVQQLAETQKNKPPGVLCPVCRTFSKKEDIRRNHFINHLLYQHKASLEGDSQTRPKQCEQCPGEDTVAGWKCLDCRFHLCQTCKTAHLKIPMLKGHSVLELSEEMESFFDQLVFCSAHPDKPIEFYCTRCEETLCSTCQLVNHNGHSSVTVQNALDRIVPDIDHDVNFLNESLKAIDQGVERCDVELEKVEESFTQCSEGVDNKIEDLIGRLRKEQQKMKAELTEEKQTQRALIEDNKNQLINKRKEIANLRNVTRTSLERARHTSLLSELVNGGLCGRLNEVTEELRSTQCLSINKPTLNTNQWTTEDGGILGEIAYTTDSVLLMHGVKVTSGVNTEVSRYWPGSFTEFFQKQLKETLKIRLPGHCEKVTVCGDKLWAPIYERNVVQIHTSDGKLLKSIKVNGNPTCVERTSTGEMLVRCANRGLFVLSEDSHNTVNIASGSYTNMCVCGDSVYTWDWKNKQIVEFVKADGDWRQKSLISVGCVQNTYLSDTLLVRQCREHRFQLEFFICAWSRHTVYQVNSQGDKVTQFDSKNGQGDGGLRYPILCGVDSHGDILVADQLRHQYKLLNTESGCWRVVYKADSSVLSATMEGQNTVWLSRKTGGQWVITKHEVIL